MKKLVAVLITGLLALTLAVPVMAEEGQVDNAGTAAKKADEAIASEDIEQTGEGKVIGVSSQHLQNDFNVYISEGIKEYLTARGYEVKHTEANGDTAQQVRDCENFIASGVDGIIVAGGESGAFNDVSLKSEAAGIPFVGVDMFADGAICGISADNYTAGATLGMFMIQQMNMEGKVIDVGSPSWASIKARSDFCGFAWEQFPGIEFIDTYEITADDPIGEAYSIVKSVLQAHPDLKGIFVNWGQPAIGAYQAIAEAGLQDQIVLASADCDSNVLEAMAADDAPIWAAMGQDPKLMGQRAAYAMDIYFTQGPDAVPKAMFGPTYIATNGDPDTDLSVIQYNDIDEQWPLSFPTLDKPY